MKTQIEDFKALALAQYEEGYDVFVEAFTDCELDDFFIDCDTWEDMLAEAQSFVDIREERRGECY
jgi:hypothetical protein